MMLNWNFQMEGGVETKKPTMGGEGGGGITQFEFHEGIR